MKTSLSHHPQNKQDQLKALAKIVLDKVPAEMIILFGSYVLTFPVRMRPYPETFIAKRALHCIAQRPSVLDKRFLS